MKPIVDQWQTLSFRERVMLGMGVVTTVILLIYAILWSPLSNAVTHLQQQVASQQKLLQWMQHAVQKIQQLKQGEMPLTTHRKNEPLLELTERTITDKNLSRYLQQVQQPQANQLLLKFQQVPFDPLMSWLQTLLSQYAIQIKKINIKKTQAIGIVDVDIEFSLSEDLSG